jgi:hypothetical protein
MLIETIRHKLSKLKTRFNKEFNALLSEPASAAAAAALAETAFAHRAAGVTYHGQLTHEKKVAAYLQKALSADFAEEQLLRVCKALGGPDKPQLRLAYLHAGQKRFPKSPQFFLEEAESQLRESRRRSFGSFEIQNLTKKARELAMELPRGPEKESILERVQQIEKVLPMLNPFARMMENFGGMFDPFFDDYDDDDDDQDDYY